MGIEEHELHWEDLAYVADVNDTSILLAWGRIPFARVREDEHGGLHVRVVDQSDAPAPWDAGFIGGSSPPIGEMRVELTRPDGSRVPFAGHASTGLRISGLSPSTSYEVRLFLKERQKDGALSPERPFATHLRRAAHHPEAGLYLQSPRPIVRRITTAPSPTEATPAFRFFVIGDQGTGIHAETSAARLQNAVAARMTQVARDADAPPLRFILGTGDNIYASKGSMAANIALKMITAGRLGSWAEVARDSGDEDDEWYTSFFGPYGELLASVPFYPVAGNHDGDETENQDDRRQLADNLYLVERFGTAGMHAPVRLNCKSRDTICTTGLFYRFPFGRDFEFVAIDTSTTFPVKGSAYMETNADMLDHLGRSAARFVVPFAHHAPFGIGPEHPTGRADVERAREHLWKHTRLRSESVRVSFFGHEHNYQHFETPNGHVVITGGAGKASLGRAKMVAHWQHGDDGVRLASWGTGGHFLECTYDGRERLTVRVHGIEVPHAQEASWKRRHGVEAPIVISAKNGA